MPLQFFLLVPSIHHFLPKKHYTLNIIAKIGPVSNKEYVNFRSLPFLCQLNRSSTAKGVPYKIKNPDFTFCEVRICFM